MNTLREIFAFTAIAVGAGAVFATISICLWAIELGVTPLEYLKMILG